MLVAKRLFRFSWAHWAGAKADLCMSKARDAILVEGTATVYK